MHTCILALKDFYLSLVGTRLQVRAFAIVHHLHVHVRTLPAEMGEQKQGLGKEPATHLRNSCVAPPSLRIRSVGKTNSEPVG